MKYEQAMWALARALYEMKRAADNGPWDAATAIERANWRNKARQCLNGWGFDDFNGQLDARVAPASEMHAATRAAHEHYLKALYAKYGPYVARVQYHDAVNALAAFASDVEWDKLTEEERARLRVRADIMMTARGFKNESGEVVFEDKNDIFYRSIVAILKDKHAGARVEALARGDKHAFQSYGLGDAGRRMRTARAYATFAHDILASDDSDQGHGSERKTEVALIDQYLKEASDDGQPTAEAPEDYKAVTASASVVTGAENIFARALYESETPADRKHWDDLRNEFQEAYKARARALPLDLPKLAETRRQQEADDVNSGRLQGVARMSGNKQNRETAAGLWVDQKISDTAAREVGVTVSDVERELRAREDKKAAERSPAGHPHTNYLKLGALAYEALRVMHPDMRPWKALEGTEQARIETVSKYAWEHLVAQTNSKTLEAVYRTAETFREIADQEGLDLVAFVNSARMRVIMTDVTKDEAELLAWYAHESSRTKVPGIVSWGSLSPGVRERKVLAAYNYVTEQAMNPRLTPHFYTALDAILADVGQFASKMERLRKARAELGSLPADWT